MDFDLILCAFVLEFDKLLRLVQRQTNVSDPAPPFFLSMLKSLESNIADTQAREKTAAKKMNATNARALNGVKQKIRRSTKEHEAAIKSYEENPEAYEAAANPEPIAITTPAPKKKKARIDEDVDGEDDEEEGFKHVGRSGKTMTFSTEALYKNLQTIQEARGKKVHISSLFCYQTLTRARRTPIGMSKCPCSSKTYRLQPRPMAKFEFTSLSSLHDSTTTPPLRLCPSISGERLCKKSRS